MQRPLRAIVAGIANTEGADPHLKPALRLAKAQGAIVHVVHAFRLPDPVLAAYPELTAFRPEEVEMIQASHLARLEAQVKEVAGDVETRCHVLPVPADSAIIRVAEEVDADLIVVGATRRGTLSRTLLGTTAGRVIRAASAPVLVNRRPGHGVLHRVVIATDLSDLSTRVYEEAMALLGSLDNCDDPTFRALLVVEEDLAAPPGLRQGVVDHRVEDEITRFLEDLSPGLPPAQPRIRLGDPATEIVAETVEWGADLLVMGTHGRGGISRFLIGSVAESAVKGALCDVLIIPAAAVEAAGTDDNPGE